MNKYTACAFALLVSTSASTQGVAQTISGVGAQQCQGLLVAAEQQSTTAADAYVSWGQGFISGFNWSNGAGREIKIDHAGLLHWLIAYCTSNPRTPFYRAMQDAINSHAR